MSGLLVLALLACGSNGAPGTVDGPTRSLTTEGLELVRNDGPTAWADTSGWRIVMTRVVAIPDSGDCGFEHLTAATIGDDGRLYVAGRGPLAVAAFDADGRCVSRFGRDGAGPGEYRYVMLGSTNGLVVVQDPMQGRVTRFAADGAPMSITPSPCCMMGPVLPVLHDGRLAIPIVREGRHGWQLTGADGDADTLWLPDAPADFEAPHWTISVVDEPGGKPREVRIPIPFAPEYFGTILPSGRIIAGRQDQYRLTVSDAQGPSVVIEMVREAAPIIDSLRARAHQAAMEGNGVLAYVAPMRRVARESDIPARWPLWTTVRGDAAGRLWVALPAGHQRIGLLHVFDSTGTLLGAVPVPHQGLFRDNATWQRDQIIVPDEDDDGSPVVRIFTIDTTMHPDRVDRIP